MPTRDCEDCGTPYQPRNSLAKRCRYCRFVRNMAGGASGRGRECILCRRKYLPSRPEDHICAQCQPAAMRADRDTEPCGSCGERRAFVIPDAMVCLPCAQDPKQRPGIVRSLLRKQGAMIDSEPPTTEEAHAD